MAYRSNVILSKFWTIRGRNLYKSLNCLYFQVAYTWMGSQNRVNKEMIKGWA